MSTYDFIVVDGTRPTMSSATLTHAFYSRTCRLPSDLQTRRVRSTPSVLLVEAGPAKEPAHEGYVWDRYTSFAQHSSLNWGYRTTPQKNLNDRVLPYDR